MSATPIIAFGQQPCGFFPKRFLVAKVQTARRLQTELGGEVVFFYHDSDHDPRETQTVLRHRSTDERAPLNFACVNKVQRKFSPLYLKRIADGWQHKTELQLPNYVERPCIELFQAVTADTVADFCLEMYRRLGLLDGIRVVRSSDPLVRQTACDVPEFFVDVSYAGEVVRARFRHTSPGTDAPSLALHEGGNSFITLPATPFSKTQISPTRDSRLRWMQSVLHCTHYVAGAGEQAYLHQHEAPEVTFVSRAHIDRSDEAYAEIPT
jgi:hypothetical protein